MSDKQAAWAFGRIFEALAEKPITEADRAYALRFFDLAMGFDFGPVDMDADEACLALGLAVEGEDPDYPGEEFVLYPSCNGYEAAKAAEREEMERWQSEQLTDEELDLLLQDTEKARIARLAWRDHKRKPKMEAPDD